MSKKALNKENVMQALTVVRDPDLNRDVVTLGFVQNLVIDGGNVSFDLVLTTPSCPVRDQFVVDCERAIRTSIDGVSKVNVKLSSSVVAHVNTQKEAILPGVKNTIAVASGKGGVGKSTVAVNLAISLANTGARVGLLDADILGPNVPMMFGMDKMPPPRDRKMVPAERYGVKVISMAFLTKPDQPLIWRGPMLHSAIRQLLTDVNWGELDYLVVDLPPGTGDAQLTLAQVLPVSGTVIVTQPMAVAISDALRSLKMFEKLEVPIIGVVENMSGEFFGTGAGKVLAEENEVPYLGAIPLDANVRRGGDSGEPVVVAFPDSPAAAAFDKISRLVAARISVLTLGKQDDLIPIEMIG